MFVYGIPVLPASRRSSGEFDVGFETNPDRVPAGPSGKAFGNVRKQYRPGADIGRRQRELKCAKPQLLQKQTPGHAVRTRLRFAAASFLRSAS
jgi:hypothetical protein